MSKQDDPSTLSLADKIARLSIDTYLQLPAKCKPVIRSNGVPEWTILAAIVLAIPTSHAPISSLKATASDDSASAPQYDLQLVSLGTGMKCLPYNRLPPAGDTLHDQHAEVLAKRGFRRWLLDQAQEMKERAEVGEDMDGGVLQVSVDGEIGLRDGVQVWLYVSTLPVSLAFSPGM
jgi:tRNA-specific adenosine deaminase 1